MKLTKEDFDQWRAGRVTQFILDIVLAKHAAHIKEMYVERAWEGGADEARWLASKAEHKILTQLAALTYDDIVALAEDAQNDG